MSKDETGPDGDDEAEEEAEVGTAETLKSIQETLNDNHALAKDTREELEALRDSHAALSERVGDLEDSEDAEEESDDDGEETEKGEDGTGEERTQEDVEAAVKSVLGIDGDLPEDADERRAVVRKGLVEATDDGTDGLGNPDSWGEDEITEVFN